MPIIDDLSILLQDIRVQVYLAVLFCAIYKCTTLYNQRLAHLNISVKGNQSSQASVLFTRIVPPSLSVCIISVTWFYIFRFIFHHQFSSESYFDDAYKDVLREHYISSTQLLTWAMVAVVWVAEEEKLSSIPYLLFGFLGAMGASFVLWIPSRNFIPENLRKRSYVPIVYGFTSILAFICILRIRPCSDEVNTNKSSYVVCSPDNGFGSFLNSFRFWLHGLHIVLLLPILVALLPIRQIQIDSALFYGIMGMAIAIWHSFNIIQNLDWRIIYPVLETDCQKSIHIDLLCCSVLTLYAIYHDVKVRTREKSYRALRNASISAFLVPLISPAAVLSFHLCFCRLSASHVELVAKIQRIIAKQRSGNSEIQWCNLGFWQFSGEGDETYEEACENLALKLAKEADLKAGDTVLSCGCGAAGKELSLYKSRFKLGYITGLDPCAHVDCSSFSDQNIRNVQGSVEDWISGRLLRHNLFNKILALDNIYHYSDKDGFLRHCLQVLPPGGKIAVTDLIWKKSRKIPSWIKVGVSAMGVSVDTLWTKDQYRNRLNNFGFCDVKIKSIGKHVFSGWKEVFPKSLVHYLDYAIIVASKEQLDDKTPPPRKKRIAVIGSGMAGLTAARDIASSSRAVEVEVKVFESNSRPGLAGKTMLIANQLVDVPPRMAALGYYKEFMKLSEELGIQHEVVKTDCNFHGNDGAGGYTKRIYELSICANLYNSIFVGGLRNLWKILRAFSSINRINAHNFCGLTFGDWLHEHLNLYPLTSSKPGTDSSERQGFQVSHLTQHENSFLYMAIGSFGWMLSCTYQQLINCPADILLPYIQGLGLSNYVGLFKKADVVRVQPSIRALEHALLHGIPFQADTKVSNLDETKIIDGIEYDAVVCATEANMVPYVIQDCAEVFSQFHYHPSTIYLHKDLSLMPKCRSDWRTWDVQMDPNQEESQLTFWLNRYYEHIDFDGDVFQTWAPIRPPREDFVIQKFDFTRVIHTPLSKRMVKMVQEQQGKNGIYYAGSYAVYGMGLLEQAAQSGRIAAKLVLDDLFEKS